jgi:multidrug efflux pump subunit AcrB
VKGLIDWFATNKVAANLLMLFIFVAGGLTLTTLKYEVFPAIDPNLVSVTVVHPGTTPEEIEEGICVKVEEAIRGLDGVQRVTSTATEGVGRIMAELETNVDKQAVLDDVKARVDSISTFPAEAERPVVVEVEAPRVVLSVVVAGETDPLTLKRIASEVRDELTARPGITRVEIANAKAYEVSIEVSEDSLRRYGLTFDDVSRAVRQSSLNLSGGTVKTRAGEILLRANTQAYVGRDFEEILLRSALDGTRITVGDVATVVDGFEDVEQASTFDGVPALTINVFRVGQQGAPDVSAAVREYLEVKRPRLPEGLTLTIWKDWSLMLDQRLNLLLENGKWGLILIFIILALFLRLKLAFWVSLGIPTAFLGAIWMLPGIDVTINMMSLFAFIVVLGIVIDDAIVVGENIYHHSRLGKPGLQAARDGVKEIRLPVILAVLTTIAAFLPMVTMPGTMGQFARVIPIIVICCLIFSLVESLLILPAHLRHMKPPQEERSPWMPVRGWLWFTGLFSNGLELFVRTIYRPVLGVAMRWRYVTVAIGLAVIILTAGLVVAGYIGWSFFPPIAGDQMVASLTMPEGTPIEVTREALGRIERGLEVIRKKYEKDAPGSVFKHALVSIGTQPQVAEVAWDKGGSAPSGSHLGEIFIELQPPEVRGDVQPDDLMRDLRAVVGRIPGAEEVTFDVAIHGMGAPINVQLSGDDLTELRTVAVGLEKNLRKIDGTFDISVDTSEGKKEIRLFVKPEAEALGITQAELTRQVRQGFYGDEAQRIQRGRDDIRIMVRYPRADRRSLADLDNMRIRLPGGGEVPFATVARAQEGRSPSVIRRADGRRTVTVTSDVDQVTAKPNEIIATMEETVLKDIRAEFPHLGISFEGEQRQEAETMDGLRKGAYLGLLLIFSLLALAFGSFTQPFVVLVAIPFGAVGALLAHWAMGLDLTLLSTIGLLAMAGVVVNDSMIMVDFVNRARAREMSVYEAVRESGPRRFRAIILTSMTTFAGLAPLLIETSVQAQFLIPMAVSLAFGVMFSTMVTLLIVPACYMILDDAHRLVARVRGVDDTGDPASGEGGAAL